MKRYDGKLMCKMWHWNYAKYFVSPLYFVSRLTLCHLFALQLIVSDFFLGKQSSDNGFVTIPLRDEFMENARLFIFETYCRIHQCIDIAMLAQKLNMNYDDAERWIVNLIRNARLDAKIDSKMGTVVMGTQHPNMYVYFLVIYLLYNHNHASFMYDLKLILTLVFIVSQIRTNH